jgi:hypothetical protein
MVAKAFGEGLQRRRSWGPIRENSPAGGYITGTMTAPKRPSMTKKSTWSPLSGLTPRGRKLMGQAMKRYKERDHALSLLEESARNHRKLAVEKADGLRRAYLHDPDRVALAKEYESSLEIALLSSHLSATTHLLRHSLSDSMYLETVVLHTLHSSDSSKKSFDDSGLKALLGEHGMRLHTVEEKFSEFDRRVSGTLGDLYSRLSGAKLESDK